MLELNCDGAWDLTGLLGIPHTYCCAFHLARKQKDKTLPQFSIQSCNNYQVVSPNLTKTILNNSLFGWPEIWKKSSLWGRASKEMALVRPACADSQALQQQDVTHSQRTSPEKTPEPLPRQSSSRGTDRVANRGQRHWLTTPSFEFQPWPAANQLCDPEKSSFSECLFHCQNDPNIFLFALHTTQSGFLMGRILCCILTGELSRTLQRKLDKGRSFWFWHRIYASQVGLKLVIVLPPQDCLNHLSLPLLFWDRISPSYPDLSSWAWGICPSPESWNDRCAPSNGRSLNL